MQVFFSLELNAEPYITGSGTPKALEKHDFYLLLKVSCFKEFGPLVVDILELSL